MTFSFCTADETPTASHISLTGSGLCLRFWMVGLRRLVNTATDSGSNKTCDANEHKHNALNTSLSVCVVVADSLTLLQWRAGEHTNGW